MTKDSKPAVTALGRCVGTEVCPLSRIPAGTTVCIKALAASPEVSEKLRALGLTEKQELKLLSRGSNFICEVCNAKLDLNAELAEAILVEPLSFPVQELESLVEDVSHPKAHPLRAASRFLVFVSAAIVTGVLVWQGITAQGNPDPMASNTSRPSAILDIAILVFREGLESILVLAAIVASMVGERAPQKTPIIVGAAGAGIGTLITWFVAVGIVQNLGQSVSALNLQAATGLLAVVVLLVVMNWFFHKIYWGGWIAMHNRNKKKLLSSASVEEISERRLTWGLILLGFASLYREGFEVVLFLQTYFLKLGGKVVLWGASWGIFFTVIVAILTFIAHRKLPYRKMLVLTGILLGGVLLVMVGEQAQEMQLAGWISTTPIHSLEKIIPNWAGLWFAVFPTVQTLTAQMLALLVVAGSYFAARLHSAKTGQAAETLPQM